MTTVRLTKLDKRADGSVSAQFRDGTVMEFQSLEHLQEDVRGPDNDADLTRRLCLAFALGRSPQLTNLTSVLDRDFTFDLAANQPIRIT